MVRRITVIVSFLATLAAVDFVVRRADGDLSAYRIDRIERKAHVLQSLGEPPEILILGSSRSAYAMVPAEFEKATGLRAFNFAIPATKIVEWRLIARDALRYMNPRLIVLGINASVMRSTYRPTYAAWRLYDARDFVEHTLAYGWSNDIAESYLEREARAHWATVGYSYEMRFWLQERMAALFPKHAQLARERRELVDERCPADGYEHPWLFHKKMTNLQEQIDELGDECVWKSSIPKFDPNARVVDELDRLLADLRSSGASVLVCYIPNSPRTEHRWRDVEPRIKRKIVEVCAQRGIVFFDATPPSHERVDADYVDESHAGLALAKEISRRSAAYIATAGMLNGNSPRLAAGVREEGAGQ